MTDIEKTVQAIRDAGIPDYLNRWIGMTPERLAEIEATINRRKDIMISLKTNPSVRAPGPKEQQQRALAAAKANATTPPTIRAADSKQESNSMNPQTAQKSSTTSASKPAAAKPAPARRVKKKPQAKRSAARTTKASPQGIRPGTKLAIVAGLLQRAKGTTTAEVLKATGWPSVSMPQQAKAASITLKQEKDGKVTRYWDATFAPKKP